MTSIAEHIKTGNQQVMDAFKKWKVNHPTGFRYLSHKTLYHAGTVKMPENR
jgi:hypothetical protein